MRRGFIAPPIARGGNPHRRAAYPKLTKALEGWQFAFPCAVMVALRLSRRAVSVVGRVGPGFCWGAPFRFFSGGGLV